MSECLPGWCLSGFGFISDLSSVNAPIAGNPMRSAHNYTKVRTADNSKICPMRSSAAYSRVCCKRIGLRSEPLACYAHAHTSTPKFKGGPRAFYTYFYNYDHARRPRLKKLLRLHRCLELSGPRRLNRRAAISEVKQPSRGRLGSGMVKTL